MPTKNTFATREEWLCHMTGLLRPYFASLDWPLPIRLRVSCGWPSRASLQRKVKVLGECWKCTASQDATTEIFISPIEDDPVKILDVLVHELCHAATDVTGHGKLFRRCCKAIGMIGKMRSASAGQELLEALGKMATRCGEYPHAKIMLPPKKTKSGGTRMIKLVCPGCGYTVRTTRKWISRNLLWCGCRPEGPMYHLEEVG